jgi:hypothetical protein
MFGLAVFVLMAWESPIGRLIVCAFIGLVVLGITQKFGSRYALFLRQQQPRDAELTRASHGFGILAVLVVAGIALRQVWRWQFSDFTNALQSGDALHWVPALALLLLITFAVMWVATGTRRALRAGAERDSRIMLRAFVKILAGAALAFIVCKPPMQYAEVVRLLWAVPVLPYAVLAVAAWLIATGAIKFSLAAKGRAKPPKPQLTPQKEPARNATLDEALEDMRGLGGRKTALDEREF